MKNANVIPPIVVDWINNMNDPKAHPQTKANYRANLENLMYAIANELDYDCVNKSKFKVGNSR